MQIITAFSAKDYPLAANLYGWIAELDGRVTRHRCVLVASKGMKQEAINQVYHAAKLAFENVMVIAPTMVNEEPWPSPPNHLFKTAVEFAREPFYWLEPDCTPLKPGWLDMLAKEYVQCGKPFMGFNRPIPVPHMTGCGIYPANISKYNPGMLKAQKNIYGDVLPWDVTDPQLTLPHLHETELIQHDWGECDKPPTFPTKKDLEKLSPKAVVFHRVKDGSLIQRLREQRGGKVTAFIPTRIPESNTYAVMAYLPPPHIGNPDIFLENLKEHPASCDTIFLSDHGWPDTVRIPEPPKGVSDRIASFVFLYALRIAKEKKLGKFIWLETDCRVTGKGWDKKIMAEAHNGELALGHLACCVPACGTVQFRKAFAQMANSSAKNKVLIHKYDTGKAIPFVNGAPAVYSVNGLAELFPDAPEKESAVMATQDRDIGERLLTRMDDAAALSRFRHSSVIKATAGEVIFPYRDRVSWLNEGKAVAVHPIKTRWRPKPETGYSFYHSGDLGDIIYALKAIKLIGGGRLVIGHENTVKKHPCRAPMTQGNYNLLLPLLEQQSYVKPEFTETWQKCSYDFNEFRIKWNKPAKEQPDTLCEFACWHVGVHPLFTPDPWITCGQKRLARIIVHRSFRYRDKFPWQELVNKYRKEMLFVGLPDEHADFVKHFGRISFYQPMDFLDMAEVINGADWAVVNQSFIGAIALGLGKNVFQEAYAPSPDCRFNRANYFNQHKQPKQL